MSDLAPVIKQRFFDLNGLPLAGGKLYSYAAGTTTPLATYTDQGGLTPNTNPVVMDAAGYANVWMSGDSYKFVLTDSTGVVQFTEDNIRNPESDSFDSISPMSNLGDMIYGGAAGTGVALPGNTTTTKKYLAQTGTGLVSAAPVWSQPTFSELSGTASIAQGGTNSGTTLNNNRVMKSSGGAIVEAGAITANKALASDSNGIPVSTATTDTELGYVSGVTSALQAQINAKQAGPLTGDVTTSGAAATIASNAVTNAKAAQMATQTIKGRTTAGTGNSEDLTATQATAILNAMVGDSGSGGTKGLVPAPASGDAAASKYLKADGTWNVVNATGGGGINYVTNTGAETDTSGWATYADAAGNKPVDGTGGTATNLTFSRSTSSPLVGTASFSMAQANSTSLQGKGVSYDFTIDSAFQASMLNVSFNYNASSTFIPSNGTTAPLNDGTTTTNAGNSDIEVFLYDVTNAILIPVSPQVITANGSNNYKFSGTFQTAYNSTSYRLIFHVASTSANATGWTFKFDNVAVGPQVLVNGANVGDCKSDLTFSPSAGLGTVTSSSFIYKRIGDTMSVNFSLYAGTVAGSTAYIQLPPGIVIDTTKLSSNTNGTQVGLATGAFASASTLFDVLHNSEVSQILFYDGSTNNQIFFAVRSGDTANQITKSNGTTIWTSGDLVTGQFVIPILGWASTVQMSQETDTRVVAAAAYLSANSTVTGVIPFDTKIYDTHGAFNTSTGLFTVPVSGYYRLSGYGVCSGSPGMQAFKNGSAYAIFGFINGANGGGYAGTVQAVAGDTLGVGNSGSVTWDGGALSNAAANIFIERVSGPAAIAATETVSCRYHGSSTTITSSLANITYTTKDFDTHGAVSAATWTCPVAGKYHVSASLSVTDATIAAGNAGIIQLNKNASQYSNYEILAAVSTTKPLVLTLNDYVQCLAGDTLVIQASLQGTTPTITASNFYNFFGVTRVGN